MINTIFKRSLPSIIILLITFVITGISVSIFNLQSVVTFAIILIVTNIIINAIYVLFSIKKIKKER